MHSGFWPFRKNFLHVSFICHDFIYRMWHSPSWKDSWAVAPNPRRQENYNGPFHLTFLSLPESWFLYVKNETSAVNAQDGADGSQHAPVWWLRLLKCGSTSVLDATWPLNASAALGHFGRLDFQRSCSKSIHGLYVPFYINTYINYCSFKSQYPLE